MAPDVFDEHVFSAAITWAALAVICFCEALPVVGFLSLPATFVKPPSGALALFEHPVLQAGLLFIFHTLVLSNIRVNLWALPLLCLATCTFPRSRANQDFKLPPIPLVWSGWKPLFKGDKSTRFKPVFYLAISVLSVIFGLSWSVGLTELITGLLIVSSGLYVYTILPQSLIGHDDVSHQQLQRRSVVLLMVMSSAFALLSCLFLRFKPSTSNVLLSSIITAFCKGFGLLIGLIDGTSMPVLSILSVSTLLQAAEIEGLMSRLTATIWCGAIILQVVYSTPRVNKKQQTLWIFIAAPILLATLLGTVSMHSSSGLAASSYTHPVQTLHRTQLADFRTKILGQSQTVEEAVIEYERRYRRRPPPKFREWVELARSNHFLLVDEFDSLMASIMPFWQLPSNLLRDRLASVYESSGILKVEIRNNNASCSPDDHYAGKMLVEWINKFVSNELLPDFDFAVNTFDEPRVSVPFEQSPGASRNGLSSKLVDNNKPSISWIDLSDENLKEVLSPRCSSKYRPRKSLNLVIDAASPRFITDIHEEQDFCNNPSLFEQHGFFQAPETLQLSRNLLPVLSQCKPKNFDDILYPSTWYSYATGTDDSMVNEDNEWDEKLPSLYWSGSSTGGHSTIHNWNKLHRQRLGLLAGSDSDSPTWLLRRDSIGKWRSYLSPWSRVSSLFNIRLNKLVQCDEDACEAMEHHFPVVGQMDPLNASISSRYAIDVDGNAFSGRFYRLLMSNTCVLKMTVFREWHDDFLWPWVHYVPVSTSYDELGELVRFLHEEPEGHELGKTIAQMGRDWSRKVLRRTDLELVNMRILMELARLLSGDGLEGGAT